MNIKVELPLNEVQIAIEEYLGKKRVSLCNTHYIENISPELDGTEHFMGLNIHYAPLKEDR